MSLERLGRPKNMTYSSCFGLDFLHYTKTNQHYQKIINGMGLWEAKIKRAIAHAFGKKVLQRLKMPKSSDNIRTSRKV
jgi:hypothetical protein